MGEIADWLTEQMLELEDRGFYDVYYNEFPDEEYEPIIPRVPKKIPTCKFCGKSPLRWEKLGERWILYEMNGNFHDCPNHPLPIAILKELASKRMNATPEAYVPPSWDEFFMRHVYLVASKSKDSSTKIGAVLVRDNIILSEGYNGLCRKLNDNVPERNFTRPEKYFWFEHGERNSIYNAARNGIATMNSVMYTQGCPCCDCARAAIQAGVKEIVLHKQWEDQWKSLKGNKWVGQDDRSLVMFGEAEVSIRYFDKNLDVPTLISEKWYKV